MPAVEAAEQGSDFRRSLGLPDFTLLVLGAIVGDGVYVVGAIGAQHLGPAQIVAWLVAGVLAAFIAFAFVQCAAIDTDVGGSYAYARMAFGPLVGFLAGWSLYLGEWVALAAFPIAFTNYFQSLFFALNDEAVFGLRLALIATVTGINLLGVRQGARTNDALTVARMVPLVVFVAVVGYFAFTHHAAVSDNLATFAPLGWGEFNQALLPIFWAYAGFELAVLPAGEVRSPHRTLPLGLVIGVAIATTVYLSVSLSVVAGLPWQEAASSAHPLASAMGRTVEAIGAPAGIGTRFMSAGALVSIVGVFIVFMLSLSRLSWALAHDGLIPHAFARLHGRYRTPYVGLLFQASSSAVLSNAFDISGLLSLAVLLLSFCYVLTALSALRLVRQRPEYALRVPGLRLILVLAAASAIFLGAQATVRQLIIGGGSIVAGLGLYGSRVAARRASLRRVSHNTRHRC